MKRVNPVERFTLYGGLCIAGLSAVLSFASSYVLERDLLETEWTSTAEILAHELGERKLLPSSGASNFLQEPAKYREIFNPILRIPDVVRIKLWDRQARVLWSDDDRLIGKRFPGNPEVQQALAGRLAVVLKSLPKDQEEYLGVPFPQLAEIFVPIRSETAGEILGVVEVYKLPTRLFASIHRIRQVVWSITIAGGLLLYVVLVPIVRRAYRKQLEWGARLREQAQVLEGEVQERTGRLVHLNALSQLVASSLDQQPVFDYIVRAATELIDDTVATLWIFDEATRVLTLRATRGMQHPDLHGVDRIPLGAGVVGGTAMTGQAMAVRDVAADPRIKNPEWARQEGLHIAVFLPLTREGRSLGVLGVLGRFYRLFTDSEMDLLASLGTQATIAIENARLFAATAQQATELSTLREIGQAIAARLELSAVLEAVVAGAIRLLGSQHAQILLWDEATQRLRYGAAVGPEAALVRVQDFELGRGITGMVAQTRQPMILDDYRVSPYALPEFPDVVATVTVPILFEDRLLGVLHSHTTEPGRRFTPDDLRLLQMLATQAAITIENARLYDAIRQHAAQLETRVREQTAELEEALQVKFQFLASMSRELRAPLNAVLELSEILLGRTGGDLTPQQERYLRQIRGGGERLLDVVTDLLDVTEGSGGPMGVRLDRLVVRDLVDEVLEPLAGSARAKQIELGTSLDPSLPTVVADHRKLAQVLHHLVTNAIRFTSTGGRVTVRTRLVEPWSSGSVDSSGPIHQPTDQPVHVHGEGKFAEFVVEDIGIGNRAEDPERIFREPRQQVASDAPRHGGAGLGLVRRLVELHGGSVWTESDGEGRRSRVIVRLPLLTAPPPPPRVLIVEDEALLRAQVADALGDAGFAVSHAPTGAEALAALTAQPLDLLVLDIALPDVDGWEVLRRVREGDRTRALPVLILTGLDAVHADQVLAMGADAFLAKPVSAQVLVETVGRLLRRRAREALSRSCPATSADGQGESSSEGGTRP
ncbi:MAG: GAF domain-containing protein [candidate division NC10 bacterium]|nr:GAF domain-containing protein [candidate division NC10 bacterium]